MSAINTNGIDVNYPIPGINNNSQGFRDNFASIKNNLNVAGTEITDLQNTVVLKSALTNSTLNNDMANTLISNASVLNFRHTTYNLGNSLSGVIAIDVSNGDVQYGTISANTTFQFCCWGPTDTQCNLDLRLSFSNSSAYVTFPSEVVFSGDFGANTLENVANVGGAPTVTVPYGVTEVDYRLSTLNCGTNITIEPYNRPRQTTQIQQRSPAPTGFLGDVAGTVAIDPSVNQLTLTSSNASDYFVTTGDTTQLYSGMAVVFTGASFEANITSGITYYVRNVVSSSEFTVSTTNALSSNVNLSGSTGNMYLNPVSYIYVATDDFSATVVGPKTVSNTTVTTNAVTLNNTTNLVVNAPIVFAGTTFGGLTANTVYYIKAIASPNVTVSMTRTNGVADTAVTLTTASGSCSATSYVGNDIWKRIALNPW